MIFEKKYDIDQEQQNIVVISLTEACNLRCKYCYMIGKNEVNKLNLNMAKKIIDFVLDNRKIFNKQKVIWDFIGGEPFLEIDLLSEITEYLEFTLNKKNHNWKNNYTIRILTNGILYDSYGVQKYVKKYQKNLTVGFSLDGCKEKHDAQRVFKNGKGSYDLVVKNVPLWLSQFPAAYSKSTFSHEDLPLLKESIVTLWSLGIKDISANIVFENVWTEKDPIIFERQLKNLADYVIENNIFEKDGYYLKFFDFGLLKPFNKNLEKKTYCSAGINEFAFDYEGRIYPCIRFLDFSLKNKKGFSLGNVYDGISQSKLNIFSNLTRENVDLPQCSNCAIKVGCATCAALNYDDSSKSNFIRTTYTCDMHKANIRALSYLYKRLLKIKRKHSYEKQ